MDITLIKTFMEVAATGSFVSASDRLFVTQSAVSLRIQRLEDSLGHLLFTRSKAGAILTPAGQEFERYALSLLTLWTIMMVCISFYRISREDHEANLEALRSGATAQPRFEKS